MKKSKCPPKKMVTFNPSTIFIDMENTSICACCKDRDKNLTQCEKCLHMVCKKNCITGLDWCFDCAVKK